MEKFLRPSEDSGELFDKLTMSSKGIIKSACTLHTLWIAKPSLSSNGQRLKSHEIAVSMELSPYIQAVQVHLFLSTAVLDESQWAVPPQA